VVHEYHPPALRAGGGLKLHSYSTLIVASVGSSRNRHRLCLPVSIESASYDVSLSVETNASCF
jgi:hypothetical protein